MESRRREKSNLTTVMKHFLSPVFCLPGAAMKASAGALPLVHVIPALTEVQHLIGANWPESLCCSASLQESSRQPERSVCLHACSIICCPLLTGKLQGHTSATKQCSLPDLIPVRRDTKVKGQVKMKPDNNAEIGLQSL